MKLDLDVRRLWTCPACGRKRRLSGDVTSLMCPCKEGGVLMQLTADAPVFKRAERLTPLPFTKKPLPDGWRIPEPEPDTSKTPVPPSSPEPIPQAREADIPPETTTQKDVADEFGSELDLPPEPPRESEPA